MQYIWERLFSQMSGVVVIARKDDEAISEYRLPRRLETPRNDKMEAVVIPIEAIAEQRNPLMLRDLSTSVEMTDNEW